jgi:hypothetical protein
MQGNRCQHVLVHGVHVEQCRCWFWYLLHYTNPFRSFAEDVCSSEKEKNKGLICRVRQIMNRLLSLIQEYLGEWFS